MERYARTGGVALAAVFVTFVLALPYVESAGPDPQIRTVGDSLWYALVTVTTVGYGDLHPKTPFGKIIGSFFVIASLGILGILIGQVGGALAARRERRRLGHHGFDGEGHVVVLGFNPLVRGVVEELVAMGRELVVVTHQRDEIDLIRDAFGEDVFPLYARYEDEELMAHAGLERAQRALLALDEDTGSLVTLLRMKRSYPGLPIVASVENRELVDAFRGAGADHVVATGEVTAALVASLVFEPDVARFARDMITAEDDSDDDGCDMQQYLVRPGHTFDGESFEHVHRELYESTRSVAVAIARANERGGRDVLGLPGDDEVVRAGDYVILIARESVQTELEEDVFGVTHGVVR